MKNNNFLICDGCGWVHFGVSLEYATNQVKEFNTYYGTLTAEQQEQFYRSKKSHLTNYCFCFLCGSLYTRMRKLKSTDKFPEGSTIQGILDPRKAKYEFVTKDKSNSKSGSDFDGVRRGSILRTNGSKRKNRRKD